MPARSPRRLGLALAGALALPVVAAWNRAMRWRERATEPAAEPAAEPEVVEHERGWRAYLRGFDAHHGIDGGPAREPADGDLVAGLARWARSRFLRGYTLGDHVYLCPRTPRAVRVHQAGHAPAFGATFEPLEAERRPDGGLPDEPLRTLDVMLPGDLPHTFCRLTDRRGLADTYREWVRDGRIRRVAGAGRRSRRPVS